MSKRGYRQFILDWKFQLDKTRRSTLTVFGNEAPLFVKEAFALWIAGWYDTYLSVWKELSVFSSRYLNEHYGVDLNRKDFRRFASLVPLNEEDLAVTIAAAKAADEQLVNYWTNPMVIRQRPTIEQLAGESRVLKILLGQIYPCVAVSTSGGTPSWCHSHIRHCLLFLSRLNYVTEEQEAAQVEDWIQVQRDLEKIEPPELDSRVVPPLLDGLTFRQSVGRHSNGAVAPAFGFRKVKTLGSKYYLSEWSVALRTVAIFCPGLRHPYGFDVVERPKSCLQFVPKQFGKYRAICMEPAANQFAQQGIKATLYEWFKVNEHLSRHIDLEHAEVNTSLACEGSVEGEFATIDVSHASDSVSWRLVQKWFAGSELLYVLSGTRCWETVVLDHVVVKLSSMATMGNATTFPVETLVFVCACIHVILTAGDMPARSRFKVYGDDIVIERKYARELCWFLEACGFTINWEKSFLDVSIHCFRESCGGHFLDGCDVTPIRIPRAYKGLKPRSPEQRSGLIELANRLLLDWPHARQAVITALLEPVTVRKRKSRVKMVRYVPAFTSWDSDDSSALKSFEPSNHLVKQLYDTMPLRFKDIRRPVTAISQSKSYQSPVVACWFPKSEMRSGRWDKWDAALYEWLRSAEDSVSESEQPRLVHADTKVKVVDAFGLQKVEKSAGKKDPFEEGVERLLKERSWVNPTKLL